MENNNNPRYKHDRVVSDFEADIEEIRRLYLHAAYSKSFWSEADKIFFADNWTCVVQRLLSYSIALHGLKHRLVLDEEESEQEEIH